MLSKCEFIKYLRLVYEDDNADDEKLFSIKKRFIYLFGENKDRFSHIPHCIKIAVRKFIVLSNTIIDFSKCWCPWILNTKGEKEWGVEETTKYDEKLRLLQTREMRVCTFQPYITGKVKKGKPKWGVNKTNKNEKILPDKSFYGQLNTI